MLRAMLAAAATLRCLRHALRRFDAASPLFAGAAAAAMPPHGIRRCCFRFIDAYATY